MSRKCEFGHTWQPAAAVNFEICTVCKMIRKGGKVLEPVIKSKEEIDRLEVERTVKAFKKFTENKS